MRGAGHGIPFASETEPLTGRELLRARSSSGVEVRVARMPAFAHAYAVLTAHYGSLDTALPSGEAIPPGTAHLLEHEMFQKSGEDLFDVFDRRGAASNAFTTHTTTSFVFSSTRHFGENLETLLGSVRTLEVEAADVVREKSIVAQEIAMWEDDPSWRGYLAAMEGLYRRHPVRIDIAGTRPSLDAIDLDLLHAVHRDYYHPRNLVLVVAGDVDPASILAAVERQLPPVRGGRRHRRAAVVEPRSVAARETRCRMAVGRPHVWLAWKDTPSGGGQRLVRRQVLSALAVDVLFGDGGRVQAPLYEEGWIDDSFHADYEAEADLGHLLLSAEVDEIAPFRRRVLAALEEAAKEGVSDAEVERSRRRLIGRRVRLFNAPESVAHWLLAVALENVPARTAADVLRGASGRSVARRFRDLISRPRATASVL